MEHSIAEAFVKVSVSVILCKEMPALGFEICMVKLLIIENISREITQKW